MSEKKFKSPEELQKKINDFIQEVKNGNIKLPTDYELLEYLNISYGTYEEITNSKGGYADNAYSLALKKLTAFREQFFLELSANRETATMAIFALKQPKNGGYSDRQKDDKTPQQINVTITSAGKDPFK